MMKPIILVVDDEPNIREALNLMLQDRFEPILAATGEEAIRKIQETPAVDLVLLDIIMPEMDGMETLRRIKEVDPNLDVIMVTANNSTEFAVKSIKNGAYDYVTKPFDIEDLTAIIERALQKKNLTIMNQYYANELERLTEVHLIGKSTAIRSVFSLIDKVADADTPILIQGESGTGKELIARAVHKKGNRALKPFVTINCAAASAEVMESELFGHEKGALSAAINRKVGKIEFANGGIVFLEDVGELPLAVQGKLLRLLQDKEITRIGSSEVMQVDVRIIAATNVDLMELVKQRRFREDLYYRLKVVPMEILPLRFRREDIGLLVDHFLKKSCLRHRKSIKGIESEALELLNNYNWPGNVRELENLVEMVVLLTANEKILTTDLPSNILTNQAILEASDLEDDAISLKKARHQFERQFIIKVLEKMRWNQTKAARAMGIHRNTLIIKMDELGIKK
jgi:DNA-binding NtrC family response regulator